MAAHWSRLIAPVPESVSRSMITSAAWMLNRFQPALRGAGSRSPTHGIRIGSAEWVGNGSMVVSQRAIGRTVEEFWGTGIRWRRAIVGARWRPDVAGHEHSIHWGGAESACAP